MEPAIRPEPRPTRAGFGSPRARADRTEMLESGQLTCSRCGRPHDEQTLMCGLCGNLLQRAPALRSQRITERPESPDEPRLAAPESKSDDQGPRRLEPWLFLGIGLVTAPIFAVTPLLGFMGWFLSSLVHEMGHSAVAWLFGMPSMPAISLEGHAAAVHSDQQLFLVAMIVLALGTSAWRLLSGRARIVALCGLGVLYPALAFSGAREFLHLLAGHGGELVFATLCLWKTLDGGFTDSRLERALYGTLGWFLLGSNLRLCFGLMTSEGSRAWYAENGSFGMTNDLIRVAEDLLGWRLQSVAALMLVVALLVLPAALLLWRASSRACSR